MPGDQSLSTGAVQSKDGKYVSLCVTEKAPGRCEYLVLASDGEHIGSTTRPGKGRESYRSSGAAA